MLKISEEGCLLRRAISGLPDFILDFFLYSNAGKRPPFVHAATAVYSCRFFMPVMALLVEYLRRAPHCSTRPF
jgi:hypothetical protein